jgi:Protein of unknown function (DUF3987)/Toprim-like
VTEDEILDLVLGKLEGTRSRGGYWMARCPAHEDREASLSIARGTSQPVVLDCHAGCATADVLAAMGLTMADISNPREQRGEWTPWADRCPCQPVATYRYTDEAGELLFEVVRGEHKEFAQRRPDPSSRSGWRWSLGDTRRVLYWLPQVVEAIQRGETVWIAEGEKDVHALEAAGVTATCNPMGAGKWRPEYADTLAGASVVIVADRDEAGRKHAAEVAASLASKALVVTVVEAAEGKDAADHLAAGYGLDDFTNAAEPAQSAEPLPRRHSADTADSAAWEPPVPLGTVPALPAFPVGIFPAWLRQEIAGLTEFAQVPADVPAVIALAALAAAAGGRAVVEIRGSWREPLNLYALTALPPGSRKSAVFAELTQPLLDTEQALIERTGPQIIEMTTQRKIAQRDAEKAAAKASGLPEGEQRDDAMANAIGAAQLAEAMTIPVMPKLVADDVTPEAAASLLAEQGGRLAVLSAEGGCFSTLAGRYSSTPNLEVFLKGHSGDMLRVDRKGRPPEHIAHPALTLGLAVQPQVLRDIATMSGFRGRGLLARILYSIPPNTVGTRKIRTDPIPEDVRDTYAASVRALVLTLAEWDDPAVLMLTPEAAELLLTTAEELEPRLSPDGDLGHIADWASKLIGATARIAGLLHLAANLQDGWGKPISRDTMAAAVHAAGYFTAHALAAFDGMGADPLLEDARHVLGWITRSQADKFTKRDLFRAEQSRFRKIADLDPVLAIVEQHGYIRLIEQPERHGPGRKPSPEYAVHPDLDSPVLRY